MAMESWKIIKNNNSIALGTLGALEKSRKRKTMNLKVRLGRRRWFWELWKKP
jgi:hypothetical protein